MRSTIRTTVVNTYLSGEPTKDFASVRRMIERHAGSDLIVFSEVTLQTQKHIPSKVVVREWNEKKRRRT